MDLNKTTGKIHRMEVDDSEQRTKIKKLNASVEIIRPRQKNRQGGRRTFDDYEQNMSEPNRSQNESFDYGDKEGGDDNDRYPSHNQQQQINRNRLGLTSGDKNNNLAEHNFPSAQAYKEHDFYDERPSQKQNQIFESTKQFEKG